MADTGAPPGAPAGAPAGAPPVSPPESPTEAASENQQGAAADFESPARKSRFDLTRYDKTENLIGRAGKLPYDLKNQPEDGNYGAWIVAYDGGSSVARTFAVIYNVFKEKVDKFKSLKGDARKEAIKNILKNERLETEGVDKMSTEEINALQVEDYQYIQLRGILRVMMTFLGGEIFDKAGNPAKLTTDEKAAADKVKDELGLTDYNIPDDDKILKRILMSKKEQANWKEYKNFWRARPSGEPSEKLCFREMISYQMELSTMDRARQSKMHSSLRNHARNFFSLGYEMYMRLNWMYSGWLVRALMGSNVLTQTKNYVTDNLSRLTTLGFVGAGQAVLNTYQAVVLKRRPTANTSSSAYAVTAIIVCTAFVAEAVGWRKGVPKTEGLDRFMLEQVYKTITVSGYRPVNAFRVITRILEQLSSETLEPLLRMVVSISNPYETFARFRGLESYKELDEIVAEGIEDPAKMERSIMRILREIGYYMQDQVGVETPAPDIKFGTA